MGRLPIGAQGDDDAERIRRHRARLRPAVLRARIRELQAELRQLTLNPPPPPVVKSKFTPAVVRQIVNLVKRGKSATRFAAVGCTVGSLQVTCSRLGISLRRRTK